MEIEKIYGDLPVLETDRLILRKMTMEDAEDMFSYGSKEEVAKYVTKTKQPQAPVFMHGVRLLFSFLEQTFLK
ncbi:N-acetyltransferase [Neobacillus notoginsengisoli]|uniref:N-acetyltransferase n=1 Tax=Neobacillus notoginsengisoli TaxID=1578198 RepID=A0A417YV40_9BACI|nr:N-acetyltransferase [Neobacillus notoginsengisoli]